MRVLVVHSRYRVQGGEDGVIASDSEALRQAGHSVFEHIVPNSSGHGAAAQLLASPWNLRQMARVRAVIREFRPDVVHVHNTWFSLGPGALAACHKEAPTVLTVHNYRIACVGGLLLRDQAPCDLCVGRSPWNGIRYGCYHSSTALSMIVASNMLSQRSSGLLTSKIDRFIVLNKLSAAVLLRTGVPRDRIVERANRVDDPGPRPGPPSGSDTFLYLGRLSEEKGVDRLLDIWRRSDIQESGLKLTIAGEGPLDEAIRSALPPKVNLLGHVAHEVASQLIHRSRALLFPSVCYEVQPLSVLEAFAGGLPVVASSISTVADVVVNGGAGWAAHPSSADEWVRIILHSSNSSIDKAGALARAAFLAQYPRATAASSLEKVYSDAIEDRARRCRDRGNFRTR